MNANPKIEKASKLLILLFIISIVGNYLFSNTLSSYLSLQDFGIYKLHLHIISISQTIFFCLINLFLGIWLYKNVAGNKWGWMLLGFVFGINAIILFYLNQVLNKLHNE
jgi:hypothetical protein